jgi:hypothetical protein
MRVMNQDKVLVVRDIYVVRVYNIIDKHDCQVEFRLIRQVMVTSLDD